MLDRLFYIVTSVMVFAPTLAFGFSIEGACLRAAVNGSYVAAEPADDFRNLRANRARCLAWERFQIYDANGGILRHGDTVFIRTHWGRYWSAQPNRTLVHDRTWRREWESFIIIRKDGEGIVEDGDRIGLKGWHGNFARRLQNPAEEARLNMHEDSSAVAPSNEAAIFLYDIINPSSARSPEQCIVQPPFPSLDFQDRGLRELPRMQGIQSNNCDPSMRFVNARQGNYEPIVCECTCEEPGDPYTFECGP